MSVRARKPAFGPSLDWEGKEEARPARVFEPGTLLKFDGCAPGGLLLRGDARDAASHLLATHEGCVNLIYLDPPFLVGSDFVATGQGAAGEDGRCFAYSDRWAGPEPYLNLLREVLILCHRLLHDEGVIYVHVDQRTSHWIRCIMQEIFGLSRDRGVIAWHMGNGVKARRQWGCAHNDILCFSKGDGFRLRSERAALREPFAEGSVRTHFRGVDENGRRYRVRHINGRDYRYYEDEGRAVGSVWTDCPSMSARSPILDEATGYPTQKPERLLERIIEASSDPGDVVVDLFCGSGTTPAVAQRLGRRWIAGDAGRLAIETSLARLLALEPAASLEVVDLKAHEPDSLRRLARLLQLREVEAMPGGMSGLLGPRRVLLTDQDEHAEAPAGTWVFVVGSHARTGSALRPEHRDARVWRCHPESPSSSSLRAVCFASEYALEARLDGKARLHWSLSGRRLRQDEHAGLVDTEVGGESIAAWMLREGDRLVGAGRRCPPEQIDGARSWATDAPDLTLRIVDAYGFDAQCVVERERPDVSVPARRGRTSRRVP